jgi:hypothetical protein
MIRSDLVTATEAAAILGRHVSTVSRALKDGRLQYADPDQKLLMRYGLEIRFARATRPKADVRFVGKAQIQFDRVESKLTTESASIATSYWERVADKLDFVLQGCSQYWPVYDAERLRVFARALDEVRAQTEMEGLPL